MNKRALLTLFVGGLFLVAGCSSAKASSVAESTPAPAATPSIQATALPEPTVIPSPQPSHGNTVDQLLTNQCTFLNSRDLAELFTPPTSEKVGPVHTVGSVNHTVFSSETVSATESSCVYYVFHRPGKKDEQFLQVTYWVDVPNQATPGAWAQLGANARAKGAQPVSGIGGNAFYENGMLTFENGNAYVTIGIIDTSLNLATPAGANQEIAMEKQLALHAQGSLKAMEK
jgi:hypothetical protein